MSFSVCYFFLCYDLSELEHYYIVSENYKYNAGLEMILCIGTQYCNHLANHSISAVYFLLFSHLTLPCFVFGYDYTSL